MDIKIRKTAGGGYLITIDPNHDELVSVTEWFDDDMTVHTAIELAWLQFYAVNDIEDPRKTLDGVLGVNTPDNN